MHVYVCTSGCIRAIEPLHCTLPLIPSVPSAPRDLTVTDTGSTSINITWSAPANANGILLRYYIDLEEETGGQLVLLETVVLTDPQTTSYSFTNLMAFILYRIEVSAATRIGEGNSTYVFETTDPDSASPPSFVSAETLTSTAIELSWGYPDRPRCNITGYIIYYNNMTSDEELELIVTLPFMDDMRNQSFIFSDLMPFTYYEFSVAAFAVTETLTHFGIPSDPVVTRTDEDCKML